MRVTYMENTFFIGCCSSFGQGEQRDCGRSSRKHALVLRQAARLVYTSLRVFAWG